MVKRKAVKISKKDILISFLLRSGLAIVFLYAAISSLLSPDRWVGFVPGFMENIISRENFLIIFSIYEIILSVYLLSNRRIFLVSILSSITLLFILAINVVQLDILFRDIAILFMSLALLALSKWQDQNS